MTPEVGEIYYWLPCEQYLLYFGQFLRDLGVQSKSDLSHEAGQVLFAVTPTDSHTALDKVRLPPSAPLSTLLLQQLALSRDFDACALICALRSMLGRYLAIAGSLVAYSAYFWLLNRFPPTLIATHTYVNPIVASVLGWSIAGEVLTARFVFGGVVVVAAIALLGRATSREGLATKIREHPHAPATQQKAAAKSAL